MLTLFHIFWCSVFPPVLLSKCKKKTQNIISLMFCFCICTSAWQSSFLVAGFEITVDHPHTDVVRCSQLVRGITFFLTCYFSRTTAVCYQLCSKTSFFSCFTASKDLAQTSYYMATNRLLSCSHYCTVMAHYSFLHCRVPLPVSNALFALGSWEPPMGKYRPGCCVRCIVQGLCVGT